MLYQTLMLLGSCSVHPQRPLSTKRNMDSSLLNQTSVHRGAVTLVELGVENWGIPFISSSLRYSLA